MVQLSLDIIKSVFQNLANGENWSIQLLNIKTSKKTGITYSSRQITLSPRKQLAILLNDISNNYTGNGKKSLNTYKEVREYDGTVDGLTIYKLSTKNTLIATEYSSFKQTIANPDNENDPFQYKSAYLLKGEVTLNNEETTPVKLISMQKPITTLKNKFMCNKGSFHEISEKVLFLRSNMDTLIVGDTVYLLTQAGENLFNMERSYKIICQNKIDTIEQINILSNFEVFKTVALAGHNPRRFLTFNDKRLNALNDKNTRISMAKQFNIPLDATGEKFDTSEEDAANKIVKLLCNKGMVDPFENNAVEVNNAQQWR